MSKRPNESAYNRLVSHNKDKEVTLSYEEYVLFTRQPSCHYCDGLLNWDSISARSAYNLDRKNNLLGYSKDNCVVCCRDCNRTKGDRFTYEEFMILSDGLREIRVRRETNAERKRA